MNTGTVAPLPTAAGEVVTDKARAAARGGAEERGEAGGFLKLVSKLAHEQGRGGRGTEAQPSAGTGDGSRSNMGAWLQNGAELPGEPATAVDPDLLDDQALPQQEDNLALLLALVGVNDAASLAQLLAANAGSGQSVDPAAVAARVLNGTATQDDMAMVRAAVAAARNGDLPSLPDPAMIANLAKANSQAEARRVGKPAPEPTAKVAVFGRETHLAPVLVAAAAAAKGPPAGTAANRVPGAQPQPAPDAGPAAITEGNVDTGLVDPHAAVTQLRDARWNANQRAGGAPMGDQQQPALNAATMESDEGSGEGAFPAASIARLGQLVNSPLPPVVVQQIAGRVAAEAGQLLGQAEHPELRGPGLTQSFGSPVKVIHIQLQPDGLGAVTIRLAVKDQALQLALEADRGETASLIQRDRDTLSSLLRSAGYLIDGVDVRTAAPVGATAPAMDGQGAMQMQGGGQSRGSPTDGRPQGAGPHDNPSGSNLGNRRNGEDEQAGNAGGRGGGLYV